MEIGEIPQGRFRIKDPVGAMHPSQIVHRDIKPRNLIYPDGQGWSVKIIDLGIARHIGQKTGRPVRHSKRIHPTEKTSEGGSISRLPPACAGDMYLGEPTITPVVGAEPRVISPKPAGEPADPDFVLGDQAGAAIFSAEGGRFESMESGPVMEEAPTLGVRIDDALVSRLEGTFEVEGLCPLSI